MSREGGLREGDQGEESEWVRRYWSTRWSAGTHAVHLLPVPLRHFSHFHFIQYSYHLSVLHTGAKFYHQTTISAFVSTCHLCIAHPQFSPSTYLHLLFYLWNHFTFHAPERCWWGISKEASRLFPPPYDTSPGSSESPLLDTQLWGEQLQSLSLWSPHFLKSYFLFNLTLIPIELNLPLDWRWHSCQLSCFPLLCLILKASDCYFYPLCEKRKIVFEASLTHGPHGTAWVTVISLHLVPLASCASYMHFLTCAWSPTPSTSLLQLKVGSLFKGDSPGREGEL